MPPWLQVLLRALYIILGGIIGGGAATTVFQIGGCNPPIVVPPVPPVPPAPPANPVDPVAATCRFYMGGVGCTCTILEDRPGPGKYWILCAAHCVRGGPGYGQAKLPDGRVLQWKLVRAQEQADVSLLIADGPEGLPVARIASAEPERGVAIWHKGYGVNVPGNVETGSILSGPGNNGQLMMRLSVSSGDSGSGIFRKDTGELVSVVCCANPQQTWGGGVTAIRRLLVTAMGAKDELPEWRPHPLPDRPGHKE